MDNNLKRSIMLEHYQNPYHKGLIDDDTYIKVNMNNESCIDEINLMVKLDKNKIVDAYFDGEACAVCTSSASIMMQSIIGKTLDEAYDIYCNIHKMLEEEEYDANKLNEMLVYDEIAKQPNRKKCVLLPWWGIEKIKNKYRLVIK